MGIPAPGLVSSPANTAGGDLLDLLGGLEPTPAAPGLIVSHTQTHTHFCVCIELTDYVFVHCSSCSAGLRQRRRDFDHRLWQTVRLRPDSHFNSLQLYWSRHQQFHAAGSCTQGPHLRRHTQTDKTFCILVAEYSFESFSDILLLILSRVLFIFHSDLDLNVPFDPPTECPVTHEGPEWRHSPCTRSSYSVTDGNPQQPKQGGSRLINTPKVSYHSLQSSTRLSILP